MRLIGNKTKLLSEIEGFLGARGLRGGTFLDVFAGTGSVARHFRGLGFRAHGNDLMRTSYTIQRAYLTLDRYPALDGVRATAPVRRFLGSPAGAQAMAQAAARLGSPAQARARRDARGVVEVVAYLNRGLEPCGGLISRQYAEGGPAERLYFSRENGGRIDAVQQQLVAWREQGLLDPDGFDLLLAALLEASDRVANISGTYGAFLKRLQTSAREPLELRPPLLDLRGPAGVAHQADANQLAREVAADVIYIDPPYNQRQYAKNYHVLEVLAELHTVADPAAYEAQIYGKTGLLPFRDRLSDYCRRATRRAGPSPCEEAFRDLVAGARAEHVVVSYSEEGILSREQIGDALAAAAGLARYDYGRDHAQIAYKRFRSDKDAQGRRAYRVLDGRQRDEVCEWLFYVRKQPAGARRRPRASA